MISCRNWWPWRKPGYITMTRRQSNNQWSGGKAAQPAPKIPSASILLRSRRHPPVDYHPKGQTMNAEYYSSLLVQLKDILKEKREGMSPRRSCSCTTMPRLTGHLYPRRNWPTWASSNLITHPILRIWPRRTTTCSLDWKKIERSPFFSRRGAHCCRGDLVGRTTFWISFLSGPQRLQQRANKCIELRGE